MKLDLYLSETKTTREAFAKRIGCTPEAVRLWCNGERQPRPKAVQAIQEATKGKVGWADFDPSAAAA